MKGNRNNNRKVRRVRLKIAEQSRLRLTVHKTPKHIYAQVFTPDGQRVLVAASSVEKDVRAQAGKPKTDLAKLVGELVAQRAVAAGISQVAFDRSGFRYHGRVRALADAARVAGLDF